MTAVDLFETIGSSTRDWIAWTPHCLRPGGPALEPAPQAAVVLAARAGSCNRRKDEQHQMLGIATGGCRWTDCWDVVRWPETI